jgi:hypothetical protein
LRSAANFQDPGVTIVSKCQTLLPIRKCASALQRRARGPSTIVKAYKILWMPARTIPTLVLSQRISTTPKKLTFKGKCKTCRETMAQIQQNIILKKMHGADSW